MKIIFTSLISAMGISLLSANSIAEFTNGDRLSGNVNSLTQEKLGWDTDSLLKPVEFIVEKLDKIRTPLAPPPTLPEADHTATITLSNGDVCQGVLLSVDDKEIVIDTKIAGKLTFRRDMVALLNIRDRPTIYYTGPNSLEEWSPSKEGTPWQFQDGELKSDGGNNIHHKVGELRQIHLRFDADWVGDSRLRVLLHADADNLQDLQSHYEMVIQNQFIYLRKIIPNQHQGRSTTIGSTGNIKVLQDGNVVRIDLFQNLDTGVVRLLVDNKAIATWTDADGAPKKIGEYLHFVVDDNIHVKLSRIQVMSWEGIVNQQEMATPEMLFNNDPFQENEDDEEEEEEENDNTVLLRNGDRLLSEQITVNDGFAQVTTANHNFKLPISRLRSFSLRSKEDEEDPEKFWMPIRRAHDIQVFYGDENRLTFELVSYSDGKITGRSQTFGEAQIDISYLNGINFNIYRYP